MIGVSPGGNFDEISLLRAGCDWFFIDLYFEFFSMYVFIVKM